MRFWRRLEHTAHHVYRVWNALHGAPLFRSNPFGTNYVPAANDIPPDTGEDDDAETLPAHLAVARIPTVYGCVDLLKNALAKTPLRFYLGEGPDSVEVDRQPGNVVDLFRRANDRDTGFELIEQLQASLDLNGNAYLFLDAPGGSLVDALWCLPAQLVRPRPGPRFSVLFYEVFYGGRIIRLMPEEVVHIRYWTPFPSVTGMAPMSPALLSSKTQRLAQRWNYQIYLRGGEASGYFENDQGIDKAKRDRLDLRIKKRYSGPENAGKPVVLPPGLKRVSSMLTHEQMKFIESYKMTKADLYEVFGIPPWMKGLKESGAMGSASAEVDERLFWENCMGPRALRLAGSLTEKLLQRIDPALRCEFDFSEVHVLQKARLERARSVKESVGAPVMSVNEGREILRLPRLADPKYDLPPENMPAIQFQHGGGGGGGGGAGGDGGGNTDPNTQNKRQRRDQDQDRKAARDAHRKKHEEALVRHEARVAALFTRIFDAMERRALAHAPGAASRSVEDLVAAIAPTPEERGEVEALLLAIVQAGGDEALVALATELGFSLDRAGAAAFVARHAGRALTNVTDTTVAMLRERIAAAIEANAGPDGVSRAVREVFDDRRANAVTIARTETAPAYNFGTVEAWEQSGVVEGKEWVAIIDDVTREAHAEADGQVVALRDDFLVGGERLQYPGAANGSAANVINCRCGMLAVLKADARLLPVARWLARGLASLPHSNGHVAPSNRLLKFLSSGAETR